jgi:drug/metabolite transporter (DMT)-like permease
VFGLTAGYLTGERLEAWQWLGALVIVASTAAIALRQRVAPPAERPRTASGS